MEDYIEANYQTVTLNSLARIYNYSPSYLSGLIREQYGRSFSDIITEVKMKHAIRLLQTTDDSMVRIAEAVGYSDKSYFLRRFKQVFGMTPSQYKEQGQH